MRFATLQDWLAWQETLHPSEIELGLERVAAVAQRMALLPAPFIVITVGGTNGKGSTVAMLEAILLTAGYRVGAYTSPHLLRYNERVRVNGAAVEDAQLCDAFERVDQARATTSLTYFEFGTLAAVDIFRRQGVDVAILEVGMGGRLDAVNVFEPDAAIVTTVDLDHAQWLGDTREAVGYEKAGIYRSGRPAVFGSTDIPQSVLDHADRIDVPLRRFGCDFGYTAEGRLWRWWAGGGPQHNNLPLPALRGRSQLQNAAGVLMVLELLAARLPVAEEHIRSGLQAVQLPGRFQLVAGEVPLILDVAHNPQAAAELSSNLDALPTDGRTLAVLGMLADKDMSQVAAILARRIDRWFLATLPAARGAGAGQLADALQAVGVPAERLTTFDSVAGALAKARRDAKAGDRIVVFGSFFTVAEALAAPV